MGLFVWGTALYVEMQKVPKDCIDMTIVGKQWMW
jgi:hypothetical protein